MSKIDQEFSWQAVPKTQRNNFWKTLSVMLGFTFFSASMLAGGELGISLSFTEFLVIVLAGNFLLGIYTGALAHIAAKTGLSTHLLAKYAFGEKGSYLPSFLLGFTQVGWFGVGVAMFAVPVANAMGWNVYALIFIFGLAMTASAIFGMKSLVILGFIAVPAIAILGGYSVFEGISTLGGLQGLLDYTPAQTLTVAAALSICIGSFISGGTLTPDFARFAQSSKQAVTATVIAFFLGNSLMFLFGAVGAMAYNLAEISEVMFLQGLMIPAIIVLGLNIWTTNDNALYASGLGFANITKISKKVFVVINGLVGTIFAMWMYNNFVGFLNVLSAAVPSIGAIIIADYFFVKRRNYPLFADMKFKTVNWVAMAAWVIGVAFAQLAPGITPLNALIGTAVIYIALMALTKTSKEKGIEDDYSKRKIAG
ncbi:cytosine permease [Cytobacillus horneckiae]|uniref:Cytosine permease n=1 Tax=Cytobacillus horneckiae TaxID=549687 RepID=A0A2N0ZG92_9BACI|nr:cytosine permease [Cytobacillus horneckiae]MEC1155764.1 cytosine permease [Cytobacillus horneckiae]MED2939303.1 cytosine permease [Cytobacillus horneckiae]PKG28529.1 cytosine permease [Cytobacillus horneckiae]